MSIPIGYRNNFQTMLEAAKHGDLALLECTSKTTGSPVYAIVMCNRHKDGSVAFAPVARLFDNNPYDELDPPQ